MSVSSAPKKRERVSVVCVFEGKILCFLAVDPTSGEKYYFLPGGKIEPGESLVECGERETLEETGYIVRANPSSRVTRKYPFHWDGQDYDCETHFYRAHLNENYHPPAPVKDQDYNKGATWVPLSQIPQAFGYSTAILDAINFLI